ncbi:hypothetical protein JOM49_006412 [Amycolatopsis magusensis]|uniref:Uncharacterized protein n=1 Tax=Amycolatopsis magusensis TaxID=882444 RepID=A0ABS4Q243_9PSEU|nr:hypothetical protein [Amycolatopsis magusensis]
MGFVIQVVPGGAGDSASYWPYSAELARAARDRLGAESAT